MSDHDGVEQVFTMAWRAHTTYQDVATIMGLPQTGSHMARELGLVLGEIAEDEVLADRPMLSAVCVDVKGKAGPGFYGLARSLGRHRTKDDLAFWGLEREACYVAWRRPLPPKK